MRNLVSLVIGIVFTALAGSAWAEFEIKRVDPSVVRIQHVLVRDGQARFAGHGTGFVISRDGLVVTNNHVIAIDPAKLPAGAKLHFVVPDGSWKTLRRVSIVATFPRARSRRSQGRGSEPPGDSNARPKLAPGRRVLSFRNGPLGSRAPR